MASDEKALSTEAVERPSPWSLKEEIETNEKLRMEDVNALRGYCESLPKVDGTSITDNLVAALLHSGEYELDKAKNIAKIYFDSRLNMPEIFSNRDVDSDEVRSAFEVGYVLAIPKRTPEGYRVVFQAFRQTDPSLYNFIGASKAQVLSVDACIHEEPMTPGYIFINDVKDLSMRHMFKCSLFLTRKLMKYNQEGSPLKIQQAHFIGSSSFTQKLLQFVKPMIRQDLFELIKFHTAEEADELFKHVPRECIPEEYGGTLADLETLHEQHIKWLREIQPKFDIAESNAEYVE